MVLTRGVNGIEAHEDIQLPVSEASSELSVISQWQHRMNRQDPPEFRLAALARGFEALSSSQQFEPLQCAYYDRPQSHHEDSEDDLSFISEAYPGPFS